ncbi:MAG: AraD1 family protein [Caldilineaceae bacterium]
MRLVQFLGNSNERRVGLVQEDGATLAVLANVTTVRDLALQAHSQGQPLRDAIQAAVGTTTVDYAQLTADNRILPPLDHPDPAHCILSGTGLDHLGSAQARNAMHAKLDSDDLTDSMKIFKIGVEGGKPPVGQIGSQPEWFYKGDGDWLVAPGQPLALPPFADDGGEEPELVGLYVIGDNGEVLRVGFALGNEFSDHVLEKKNYLYLAHSKLRNSSFGPELLIGEPPADIRGTVRILRDGAELWSGEFLTGEANMTYTLANIEHHHFKYAAFRRPGDVHCHFYGTATLSFAAGIQTQPGDIFEISAPEFGQPLRNPLQRTTTVTEFTPVKTL